ncbi:IclR family transcriptional regulator [Streptomyces sp. 8N114]|uniref:IclR family transcriptional regulator n=1 Tax=Streptomyces sp. 8N114 TaxID=3457419 RepID=UPI003FD5E2C0
MAAQLREAGLPHLQRLTHLLHESANLTIRAGDTARFIASIESDQLLRVGSREGMVFPAHRTSGGMLLLAELGDQELDELYAEERYADRPGEWPDLNALRRDLARVWQSGFALNKERSERGVVALGVPIRSADDQMLAGLSISMPTVRYESENLISYLAALKAAATRLEADLAAQR